LTRFDTDCTCNGSRSWHWQRFAGHELRLQIQPSLLVCAVFQRPPPRKGWLVKTDYRSFNIMNDRGAPAEGSVGAAGAVETEAPISPKLIEAKPIKANALDEEKA
jgi:hypothetical protein